MALKPPPKKGAGGAPPASANPLKKKETPAPAPPAASEPTRAAAPAPRPSPPPAASAPQPAAAPPPRKAIPAVGAKMAIIPPVKPASGPASPQTLGGQVAKADLKVEEQAFAIPTIKNIKEAPLLRDFFEKIVSKFHLADTSQQMLEAFSNIDVTAEKVSLILKNNPYYEFQFLKVIESYGKREELPKLEAAVVLLGMQNSRNLILAMQILRGVKGTHPERDKNGKLKVNPAELLRYALKTEEMLGGKKENYADTGYAAGLVFDLLALLADDLGGDNKKAILSYIDSIYLHGLKTAQIGSELAHSIPDFGFTKFVFSACLFHDFGKILMALSAPAYLSFVEECSKKGLSRTLRLYAETKRFGVNHAILGGIALEYLQMFKLVSKAVFYHHEPYLLQGGKRGLGQLASLICLSTNMANNLKKVEKPDDPVLGLWKGAELQGFKVDTRLMITAATRAL